MSSCPFNVAFTICLGVLSFCSFLFDFFFSPLLSFSLFLSLLCHVACEVLVLYQGAGPESQRWETQIHVHWTNRGLPTSWNIHWQELSQRPPSQHQDLAPLKVQQATVLDASHQITSKTGAQTHPLDKLPKAILNSQTPQNTDTSGVQRSSVDRR